MVKTSGKSVKIYHLTENGLDIPVTKKPSAICICAWARTGAFVYPHRFGCRNVISDVSSGREVTGSKQNGREKERVRSPGNYLKARSRRKRSRRSAEHVWRKYCLRSYGSVKREWVSTTEEVAPAGYENQVGYLQCGEKEDLAQCLAGGDLPGNVWNMWSPMSWSTLERGHNRIFYGYMDAFCPRWKSVKTRLNSKMSKRVSLHGFPQKQQKLVVFSERNSIMIPK